MLTIPKLDNSMVPNLVLDVVLVNDKTFSKLTLSEFSLQAVYLDVIIRVTVAHPLYGEVDDYWRIYVAKTTDAIARNPMYLEDRVLFLLRRDDRLQSIRLIEKEDYVIDTDRPLGGLWVEVNITDSSLRKPTTISSLLVEYPFSATIM